jgi:alpha-ketoglutarate-dependent taurine dioxygenase
LSWSDTFGCSDRAALDGILTEIGGHVSWLSDGSAVITEDVNAAVKHRRTETFALGCPAPQWHIRRLPPDLREQILRTRGPNGFHQSCSFSNGEELGDDLLDEILSSTNSEKLEFMWKTGDVLILDNEVFLHGRNAFHGTRSLSVALGQPRNIACHQ